MSENQHPQSPSVAPRADRRRLLGAGLAAPVLMTVASQPVMAAKHFCSPSGWKSGRLASSVQTPVKCTALSPGCWKQDPGAWSGTGLVPGFCTDGSTGTGGGGKGKGGGTPTPDPAPMPTQDDLIDLKDNGHCMGTLVYAYLDNGVLIEATRYGDPDAFGSEGSTAYDDAFMMQFLRDDGASVDPIVWHLTAALLNVRKGLMSAFISEAEVKAMWSQLVVLNGSSYETPSGLTLTRDEVEAFLDSTYGNADCA